MFLSNNRKLCWKNSLTFFIKFGFVELSSIFSDNSSAFLVTLSQLIFMKPLWFAIWRIIIPLPIAAAVAFPTLKRVKPVTLWINQCRFWEKLAQYYMRNMNSTLVLPSSSTTDHKLTHCRTFTNVVHNLG